MRYWWVQLIVAACASERVDELEAKVKRLENDTANLHAWSGEFRKSVADEGNAIRERLHEAGIVDENIKTIARWWCFSLYCARTEEDCELRRSQLRVAWRDGGEALTKSLAVKCAPSPRAFCQGRFCYRELDACLIKERETPAWPCLGVE